MTDDGRRSAKATTPRLRDDLIKLVLTGVLGGIVGVMGAILTFMASVTDTTETNNQLKEVARLQQETSQRIAEIEQATTMRDLNLKMIDISLSILAGEKGGADKPEDVESYRIARNFAILALSKASEIPISDTDRENWANGAATPLGSIPVAQPMDVNADAALGVVAESTKFSVCVGEFFRGCPASTTVHVGCSQDIQAVIDRTCPAGGTFVRTLTRGGNACGYATFDVTCAAERPTS